MLGDDSDLEVDDHVQFPIIDTLVRLGGGLAFKEVGVNDDEEEDGRGPVQTVRP